MSNYIKFFLTVILFSSFLCILIFNAGCSSSEKTTKKETTAEEVTPEIKPVKNLDELEREYIAAAKISSIEKIQFDYDKNGKPSNREKLSKVIYDKNGVQTETIIFDKNENIDFRYVYKYEKDRRVQTLRFNSKGVLDKKYTYEYNSYGNKIRSERYSEDGLLEKYYLYEYDGEGNLIEDTWYDKNGEVEYVIKYDYDKKGRKEFSYSFDGQGTQTAKYRYRYDEKNSVIEEERYGEDNNLVGLIQYLYYH